MNYCTMITIRTIIMDTGKLIKISADWLLWFHLQNRGRWKACCEKNSFALLFRVAARLLHSGKLTAVQRRCFIAYFIKGKTVAEIAHDEKTYRMTIWRHIRRLEAALRDAV